MAIRWNRSITWAYKSSDRFPTDTEVWTELAPLTGEQVKWKTIFDEMDQMAFSYDAGEKTRAFYGLAKILYFFPNDAVKHWAFLKNNYLPRVKSPDAIHIAFLLIFFQETEKAVNKKEVFSLLMDYVAACDPSMEEGIWFIRGAVELESTDEFDMSLLDFLTEKMTAPKMMDWGVGQVMKAHPKKFQPKQIRAAIEKRFFPGHK